MWFHVLLLAQQCLIGLLKASCAQIGLDTTIFWVTQSKEHFEDS